LLSVLRVLGLRDEIANAAEFRRFRPAIEKADLGTLFRPVLNFGDHGGDGDHPDRQERLPQQVIQKTAFAGLEPAQNRDVENLLLGEGLAALQKLFQGADLVTPAERTDGLQRFAHGILGDRNGCRFGHERKADSMSIRRGRNLM
jgi:hypothetical protein